MAASQAASTMHEPKKSRKEIVVEKVKPTVPEESGPPTPDGTGLPANFDEVMPGLFRSSYPQEEHFEMLKTLNLKTIVTLVGGSYPEANVTFMEQNGIKHYQIPIPPHKQPQDAIPHEDMVKLLLILLDPKNYPLLVHCNKGKHRTGCTIACLRKVQAWSSERVITEYRRYSAPKSRALDEIFIKGFDCEEIIRVARKAGFLPTAPSPPESLPRTGKPQNIKHDAAAVSEQIHGVIVSRQQSNDEDSATEIVARVTARLEELSTAYE